MFKNLFSKKSVPVGVAEVATKVSDVFKPEINYTEAIEKIHNEFNNAGDIALAAAKEIIANTKIENEEKANSLKQFGFHATKEVVLSDKAKEVKAKKQKLANALEYYSFKYPMYKFIPRHIADNICKKYSLVIGDVGQYTGFVPEKNVKQITKFFETENEINTFYYISYGGWGMRPIQISKKEYDAHIESQGRIIIEYPPYLDGYAIGQQCYHHSQNSPLKIAAPLKDMKTEGYKLSGNIFVKEIPDPVVLAPLNYEGEEIYCIVTAWGDEASDEMVVNEISN